MSNYYNLEQPFGLPYKNNSIQWMDNHCAKPWKRLLKRTYQNLHYGEVSITQLLEVREIKEVKEVKEEIVIFFNFLYFKHLNSYRT